MNIIVEALAFLENYFSSDDRTSKAKNDIYLQNAVISLVSYKRKNPDSEVYFVTNFEVPDRYKAILCQERVNTCMVPYNSFLFEQNLRYSLAYYKLCAYDYVVKHFSADHYLLVDCDSYCIDSLENIWEEADQHIMALEIPYSIANREKSYVYDEYSSLYGTRTYFQYFGSEFICANKEHANLLIDECIKVFNLMIRKNVRSLSGDEFVWNCAYQNKFMGVVKNARAYVARVFTTRPYIFSSDFNLMKVLHCPLEKESGFIMLFKHLEKTGQLFPNKKVYKIFGLKRRNRPILSIGLLHARWYFRKLVQKKHEK